MKIEAALVLCLGTALAFSAHIYKHDDELKLPESRITHGILAEKGQFPWQAAVAINKKDGGFAKCGGSLIHPNYVLTAAHCIEDASRVSVWFGVNKFYGEDPVEERNDVTFIPHPNFNRTVTSYDYDIALLYFEEPVKESDYVKMIALPEKGDVIKPNEKLTVSGFGLIESGVNHQLYYLNMTSITNEECDDEYDADIKDGQICCRGKDKLQSICGGDSGGPLIKEVDDKVILVGVVSFSSLAGCLVGKPSGLTRTEHYLDWIAENMKN